MWENIVGHETVKKTLINALKKGKVAHAYLMTGPNGLGKDTLARHFAQAFFCSEGEGEPCNACSTCKKIQAGNHPDLHIVEPTGSTIKIDQIREIQKSCQFKPYESSGKVFIIKSAETMTVEAANCLLKILEEPTHNTVFILTAENPYMLLPTVISRCQKLSLQPTPIAVLCEWLVGQGFDEKKARVASSLSDGIPGKALNLINSEEPGLRKDIALKAGRVHEGDIITVLRIAEEMENNKETVLDELDLLALWYRDLVVWSTTREEVLLINIDMVEEIRRQAAGLDVAKLQRDLANIMKTRKNLGNNANLRLSLENLLLKLMKSA